MTVKKLFELASKTNRHRVIRHDDRLMLLNQKTGNIISFWNGGQITKGDLPYTFSISCSILDAAKALRIKVK